VRKRFFEDRLAGLEEHRARVAPGFFPQSWWCRSKLSPVNCPPRTAAAFALEFAGHRSTSVSVRLGRHHLWQHDLAVASSGRDPTLVSPLLDLSTRPTVRHQGRPDSRSVCPHLGGKPLRSDEFVISADEKTSIQARRRIHSTAPPQPHRPMRVEHEYVRCGAWAYIAALDVHHARVFGRCESTTGIAPFDRLVEQVMTRPPYNEARRVFWIVDNGSSHRGAASVSRLQNKFRRLTLVHGPVHAVGSTRSRSISRSYSGRFFRPTTSLGCKLSPNVCSTFSTTGKRRPSLRVEIHAQ